MLPKNLSIIDVETTGTNPKRDRIIEIGILRIEDGKIVNTFESLVNPGGYIPPEITLLTGIVSEQLENAPTFYSLNQTIRDLLSDSIFVAHNARFDYSFVKSEFLREEESFRSKLLCTAKLSRRLFPRFGRHNLDSIIERFAISCKRRHRALDDAKVLWEFLQKVTTSFQPNLFAAAINDVTKTATLPAALTKQTIDELPEEPGVYIFYNDKGAPIYIGKSINLKERILSHFANSTTNSADAKIFQSIASLETKQTNGELGALLLESHLIKTQAPILNRALRKRELMAVLFRDETSAGYLNVRLEQVDRISQTQTEAIVGMYKNVAQAKKALEAIAKEHTLCKKLFGLEKTQKSCFGYQLGTCFGACIGKEMPARYNLRFAEAFAKTKIRSWPFPGAIAVKEGNAAHIISNWCYLGLVREIDLTTDPDAGSFDYDTYKILARFLLSKNTVKHNDITVIPIPHRNEWGSYRKTTSVTPAGTAIARNA